MRVKAKVSFAGQVSAASGEVLDLPDGSPVLEDLLRAGYVFEESAALEERKPAPKRAKQEG